jgi:hypothetical protein
MRREARRRVISPRDHVAPAVLSVELEALSESREHRTPFFAAARRPVFAFSDACGRFGRWIPEQRTIEIARRALAELGWGVVVEVLKHEIAHQYVDEVLRLREESAHGPAFRQVCAERGFDARAAGAPDAPESADEARVLSRVAKLLALAESPNVHEAQAAMNAAQRLMLKYNLETVASGRTSAHRFRHIGRATGRVSESERVLAAIIGDHFFVQVIWVPVWRPSRPARQHLGLRNPENLRWPEYVHFL